MAQYIYYFFQTSSGRSKWLLLVHSHSDSLTRLVQFGNSRLNCCDERHLRTILWRLKLTNYQIYIPRPPLAAYVDKFWLYEGNKLPHTKERRLPDGSMEMVFNLYED